MHGIASDLLLLANWCLDQLLIYEDTILSVQTEGLKVRPHRISNSSLLWDDSFLTEQTGGFFSKKPTVPTGSSVFLASAIPMSCDDVHYQRVLTEA